MSDDPSTSDRSTPGSAFRALGWLAGGLLVLVALLLLIMRL